MYVCLTDGLVCLNSGNQELILPPISTPIWCQQKTDGCVSLWGLGMCGHEEEDVWSSGGRYDFIKREMCGHREGDVWSSRGRCVIIGIEMCCHQEPDVWSSRGRYVVIGREMWGHREGDVWSSEGRCKVIGREMCGCGTCNMAFLFMPLPRPAISTKCSTNVLLNTSLHTTSCTATTLWSSSHDLRPSARSHLSDPLSINNLLCLSPNKLGMDIYL